MEKRAKQWESWQKQKTEKVRTTKKKNEMCESKKRREEYGN